MLSREAVPLALALYVCTLGQSLSRALELRSSAPFNDSIDPNHFDTDDWIDDILQIERDDHRMGRVAHPTPTRPQPNDSWCPRSRYIRPSREDIIAKRDRCSDTHVVWHKDEHICHNPFGQHLRNKQNETFFYLEIPKAGSCTFRQMTLDITVSYQPLVPMNEADVKFKAFAFVRHPTMRFVSAYGTVLYHLTERQRDVDNVDQPLLFMKQMEEPRRFNTFVRLFVKEGTGILKWYHYAGVPCLLEHFLSQTWFLNFWPGPIEIYDVDHFAEGVRHINSYMKLNLTVPEKPLNQHSGSHLVDRDLLLSQRDSIELLNEYFKDDLARFGYKPLTV